MSLSKIDILTGTLVILHSWKIFKKKRVKNSEFVETSEGAESDKTTYSNPLLISPKKAKNQNLDLEVSNGIEKNLKTLSKDFQVKFFRFQVVKIAKIYQ